MKKYEGKPMETSVRGFARLYTQNERTFLSEGVRNSWKPLCKQNKKQLRCASVVNDDVQTRNKIASVAANMFRVMTTSSAPLPLYLTTRPLKTLSTGFAFLLEI